MMENKKKILAVPIMAVGHVNATIGLLKPLLKRGYRIAFFCDTTFEGKFKPYGFEEIVFKPYHQLISNNAADNLAKELLDNDILGQKNLLQQVKNMIEMNTKSDFGIKNQLHWNNELKKAIEQFQPDLFVVDNCILLPEIYNSGKPWINSISAMPLFYFCDIDNLPPPCTGFSMDSDRKEWIPFKELLKNFLYHNKDFNDAIEKAGYKRYPGDVLAPKTEALTVYAFPEEYNYPQIKELKKDWFNIEVYNKNENNETVDLKELLPKEFYEDDLDGKWTGKWIYLSMGSMGSADLKLMHRLIEALAKSNHKYIVSKGPKYQEYELARNMWGDRYLPQTEILPLVDLVITHGGNNTVTETFAQGKPMIIMPLFGDQLDNAQRLHETGYGIRVDPHSFTEQQLHDAIERLLNDKDLKRRLAKASERILKSNKHEQFADLVDKILSAK